MPILPLDHPDPYMATLGIMLYPGLDEGDRRKAKAYAAQRLAITTRRMIEHGYQVPVEARARLYADSGEILDDLHKRWDGGLWVADLYVTLFALWGNHKRFASFENAIRACEPTAARTRTPGVRSTFMKAKKQFETVAHLWAAWGLRGGKLNPRPEVGYDARADFQVFLAEAEAFRDWGQNWHPKHTNAKAPLPEEVWCVPDQWQLPERQPDWPEYGFYCPSLPDDLLSDLRPVPGS